LTNQINNHESTQPVRFYENNARSQGGIKNRAKTNTKILIDESDKKVRVNATRKVLP
jgi:hypothetical protein